MSTFPHLQYFKAAEFGGYADKMDREFLSLLDECRALAGVPFRLNSHYRSPERNASVGGVKDSAHTRGYAVDIHCPTSGMRHKIVQAALEVGFTRIGIGSTFVHLDADPSLPQNVMWTYS